MDAEKLIYIVFYYYKVLINNLSLPGNPTLSSTITVNIRLVDKTISNTAVQSAYMNVYCLMLSALIIVILKI